MVGIFPNDAAITQLVGAMLTEQHLQWPLEGLRMLLGENVAAIPALEGLPTLPSVQEAAA